MSGNSSLPVDSGTCPFSWMAVLKTCKATGIETGTGTIDYAMPRGGSASTDIVFNNGYNDVPVVIVSSMSIIRDMTINTCNKTKNGASVRISLSSNSSLPNDQGTYSFVWMAIARHY